MEGVFLSAAAVIVTHNSEDVLGACREAITEMAPSMAAVAVERPQAGFSIRRFPTAVVPALELLGINRLWPGNLLNRRDVWESLGGFDEGFHPVWFEDVDFCRRATQAGYRIEYVPEVRAEHSGGHPVSKLCPARREQYWYGSLLTYAAGHFGPLEYRGVCLVAMLSSIPRTVAGMIGERTLRPLVRGFKIIRFTGRRLASRPATPQRTGCHTSNH